MFDTVIEGFQKLEFIKQRPEFLTAVILSIAFIFSAKSILDFIDNSYAFLDKIRYRKYLRCKEILDSPLTIEEHKNLAQAEINRFHFMQLQRINTNDKQLRHNLIIFAEQAESKNIWKYIRKSIEYLIY